METKIYIFQELEIRHIGLLLAGTCHVKFMNIAPIDRCEIWVCTKFQ